MLLETVVQICATAAAFHPIYAVESASAGAAMEALGNSDAEAVVLLGTGLPTLRQIKARPMLGQASVLSSNLCLAWRLCTPDADARTAPDALAGWAGPDPTWATALP